MSKAEWDATSMYLIFGFKKNDPSQPSATTTQPQDSATSDSQQLPDETQKTDDEPVAKLPRTSSQQE